MAFESPGAAIGSTKEAAQQSSRGGFWGVLERITMGAPIASELDIATEPTNRQILRESEFNVEQNIAVEPTFEPLELVDFGRAAGSASLSFNEVDGQMCATLSYNDQVQTRALDLENPTVHLGNLPPNMHFVVTVDKELQS